MNENGESERPSVVFLANDVSRVGGTYRVLADLVRELYASFDVTVIALEGGAPGFSYPAPVRVRVPGGRAAGRVGRTAQTALRLPRLAHVLRDVGPDVVISFLTRSNLANVLLHRLLGQPYTCVLCERNFSSMQYGGSLLGETFKSLMRLIYARADRVVANAQALADDLHENFAVPRSRLHVIHNPFALDEVRERAQAPPAIPTAAPAGCRATDETAKPLFLNAARYVPQKNQMLLLHAFAEVRAQDPCRLLLMGEGPLLAELRAEAHRLGVAGDVQFLGWQDNPYPYMQRADAFVLSSNHEGFPSVLVEAMACGCPVISTDCPSGPAEILNPNGASCCGQLVPTGDAAALAAAMREVVRNPAAAQRMAARATERIEAFRLEKIAPEFEDLIRMAAQA